MILTSEIPLEARAHQQFTARLRSRQRALAARLDALAPRGVYIVIAQTQNRLYLKRANETLLQAVCSAGSGMVLRESGGKRREWVFDSPRGRFEVRTMLKNPVWRKPDWAFVEEGESIPTNPADRLDYGTPGRVRALLRRRVHDPRDGLRTAARARRLSWLYPRGPGRFAQGLGERQNRDPDLMPKLDGYAFVQKLRLNPETRSIPVVCLSATYVTPEDKDFALSLRASRFLEKPIDTEDFVLTVAELVTQQPFTSPLPLDMERFYTGYRTRLENKLRHKNTHIARAERLLPTLPPDQKPAFEALLQQSIRDRDEIQTELYDIYKTLEALKK